MGFLSKFFGGDGGAPKSESAGPPRSTPEAAGTAPESAAKQPPAPPPASTKPGERDPAIADEGPTAKVPIAAAATAKPAPPTPVAAPPVAAAAPPVAAAAQPPPPSAAKPPPPKAPAAAHKLGGGTAKLGATAPLIEKVPPTPPAHKVSAAGADKSPAEKPSPEKAAADKVSATADKAAGEKPGAEKAAAPADKPAGAARGGPPERRRALEDSVVTSAPKLPLDPAKPPARPGAKAAARTAPGKLPAVTGEKAGATDKAGAAADAPDKAGAPDKPGAAEKVAAGEKPAPSPLEATAASVPAALRPRRDHSKSPGFYSSVSPAHGATAVAAGPFASSQQKKATVVGIAPPPAEPGKPGASGQGAAVGDALTPESPGVDTPVAEAGSAAAGEPTPRVPAEASPLALEDGGAPPQPVSSPPSVAPLAREEKEETSPGLGQNRSPHDPGATHQIATTDLELLLAFALDLALGCVSDAWFVPLRAGVGRLLAGDAALRNPALEKALTTLANDLEQPGAFNEENRQRLYGHVVAVDLALSKRMDVTGQKAIRERLIVDQLLDELGQAHPLISRRLKDQGPLSLENLGRLSPEDLSAKLEAPTDTAAQVASIFQGYLEARVRRGPSVALLGKSVALRERLSALEASAEAFERASEGEDSGARRQTRKQRQTDVAQLNLLLAELGEAKTLAEIERCSVQAKIERLQRLLGEQEDSAGRRAKPSTPA